MLNRGVGDDSQKFPSLLHRLTIEQFRLQIVRLDDDFVQHGYRAPRLHPPRVSGKIDATVRRLDMTLFDSKRKLRIVTMLIASMDQISPAQMQDPARVGFLLRLLHAPG